MPGGAVGNRAYGSRVWAPCFSARLETAPTDIGALLLCAVGNHAYGHLMPLPGGAVGNHAYEHRGPCLFARLETAPTSIGGPLLCAVENRAYEHRGPRR